jgi:GntR family transcriptional regulator/MocR family aminotransferase
MRRALSEGVLIEPGTPFYADPEEGRHRFRLGFSSIPAERIDEGVRRLRAVIDSMG